MKCRCGRGTCDDCNFPGEIKSDAVPNPLPELKPVRPELTRAVLDAQAIIDHERRQAVAEYEIYLGGRGDWPQRFHLLTEDERMDCRREAVARAHGRKGTGATEEEDDARRNR